MKKYLSLILIVSFLFSLVSCRRIPDSHSSSDEISVIEETVYQSIEQTASDTRTAPKVLTSTIATPKYVYFYNGGKYGTSTDTKLNREIAQHIETWYGSYEFEKLPFTNLGFDEQFIPDIKCNEMVIELFFDYNDRINFLGKFDLGDNVDRLLIPLTGEYAYYIFRGSSNGKYQGGPYNLNGSGLEKYFEGITIDQKAQDWQSTVIVPTTVTFYKDGMQSVSTDKELNHKIARHIEEWFKYEKSIAVASLLATTDRIEYNRRNEMAIELQFDGEIKFYGGIINQDARTLFIPLTGDDDYLIFSNSINAPDDWSAPLAAGGGLEQYFDYVQFTPLTEEEKRWRSTISTPGSIKFYENGKLIYESEDYGGYALNREIAKHIESWFYKKENVQTVTVTNQPLETAWGNDTYIKLWFGGGPAFYGENIVSNESAYLIIPLTGDYAYHIFEGDYDRFSDIAYITDGSGLEQFFEKIKETVNS